MNHVYPMILNKMLYHPHRNAEENHVMVWKTVQSFSQITKKAR